MRTNVRSAQPDGERRAGDPHRSRLARLGTAVGVRAGEGPLTGWMAALFAITQAGHGLGANTADALFFLRFGVEFLPLMILISGLVVMLATVGYMVGLARIGPRRWLAWTLATLATWLIVERVGVVLEIPGIYPVIWLGGQVAILVSLTALWNAAGEVSSTRQAKRLYPLFASAGIAGGVMGNALTGPLAVLLGTENLLLVHAGLFAAAAAVMRVVIRRFAAAPDPGRRPEHRAVLADLRSGFEVTRSTPLLRLAAAVAFALFGLFFLVTFPFSEVVARSFATESEVAGYLGAFSAAATALTFLVSFFVTNRLLARIGVVATLLIVPLVYVAGFALWVAAFGLVTASLVRGLQWIAVNAIAGTAQSSLFNVLPGRHRGQVLAFVAGVPTQLGTVAAGALLLVGLGLPVQQRAAIGLAVAVLTTVLVMRMRPAYGQALLDAVRQGLTDVFTTVGTTPAMHQRLDADAMRTCSVALEDPRPRARAVAAMTLTRLAPDQAAPLVSRALNDPDPRVRVAALHAVGRQENSDEIARDLLADPSPQVRRRALHILERRGADLGRWSGAALADPDPAVRATAAVLVGGPRGRTVMDRMLASDEPADLTAALGALAHRRGPGGADPAGLADHPNARVRAAVAPALVHRAAGMPVLTRMLDDRSIRVRTAAAKALAADKATAGALLDVLRSGSVRATDAAVRALADAGLGGDRFLEWIDGEVGRARYLRHHGMILRAAPSGPAQKFLALLLLARHARLSGWALMAMSTKATEPALAVVRRGIRSNDAEIRAQALEALDAVADRSLTRGLLRLLEDDAGATERDVRTSLRTLAHDHDHWIRAVAVRCLFEDVLDDLDHLRAAADADQSGLVRAALSRWTPSPMEETHTLDLVDCVIALHEVPLFTDLDPEELERVALVTTERRYDAGEVVYRHGAAADDMLLIIAGEVEVRRPAGDVIRTLGPGEHVGELALLRGGPRSADVVAGVQGLHALALGAPELLAILEERPEIAMTMLATLAERLTMM